MLPRSAQWEPVLPIHVDGVELDLYRFPYESVPAPGFLNQWACIVEQDACPTTRLLSATADFSSWFSQMCWWWTLIPVMLELLVCTMYSFPNSQGCYIWPVFAGPDHPSCDEERWRLLLLECLQSWCYAWIAPCWCSWRCFGRSAGSH
jgi:hypothetical protein